MGFTELLPLLEQIFGFFPSAGHEAVEPQQQQGVDGRGDGTPLPSVADYTPQRLAKPRRPVHEHTGGRQPHNPVRVDLMIAFFDQAVELFKHGGLDPDRVAEGTAAQGYKDVGSCTRDGLVEEVPQISPPTEEAHHEQAAQDLVQDTFVSGVPDRDGVQGPDQQPVGRVDIARTAEKHVRGSGCGVQWLVVIGIGLVGGSQQLRSAAQLASDIQSQIGRFGQPTASVAAARAQLG